MAGELGPGCVLVVDDEPHLRDMLHAVLTTMGAEVVTVANGAQALEAVPTFQPDVILVYMMTPGLTGTEVRDQRHLEWTPSRIIGWAQTIGPETAAFVEAILADRPHPEQGYRSCLLFHAP